MHPGFDDCHQQAMKAFYFANIYSLLQRTPTKRLYIPFVIASFHMNVPFRHLYHRHHQLGHPSPSSVRSLKLIFPSKGTIRNKDIIVFYGTKLVTISEDDT